MELRRERLSPRARFLRFLQGEVPGPLVALWRHFPGEDQDPERLAEAHAAFYRRFRFDFLKVTWTAGSLAQPWGLEIDPSRVDAFGVYAHREPVLRDAAGWARLAPAPPGERFLDDQLRVLRLLRRGLGPEVALVPTLFSPLTTAASLSGGAVYRHLEEDPAAVRPGLAAIAETLAAFARASREAGADAIFFATSSASSRHLSLERFRAFGRPFDLSVMAAAGIPTLLHVHGADCFHEELNAYPAAAINWHDRRVGPSLAEMRRRTDRILAGGVNDQGVIGSGQAREVDAEVADALAQVPDRRLIIAPGCVIPTGSPAANLDAALAAVRRARGENGS